MKKITDNLANIQGVEVKLKSVDLEDDRTKELTTRLITDEGNFTIVYNDKCYYVNFYAIDPEEHDTICVRVFRGYYPPLTDENLLSESYLDSTGGSIKGEEISTGVEEVDEIIMDFLFGGDCPIVIPF